MSPKNTSNGNEVTSYGRLMTDTSEHLKRLIEVAGAASLFSGQNLLVISAPGTGKTSILYYAGKQVWGDGTIKIECTPSLREERLLGFRNPAFLLESDAAAKGVPEWVYDGTPRDPNVSHVVLAELSRIGDLANDALVHVMDDVNPFNPVTFWGDSNWLTPTQRNLALRDRFAMTMWYSLPVVDLSTVMSKPEIKTWKFDIPDAETIYTVREWLDKWMLNSAKTKAFSTIIDALHEIQKVIEGKPFEINHRRVRQWQKVMYTMGAWYAGKQDFSDLPSQAFEALSYCYPTESPEHALLWSSIVMAAVDVVATKIAEYEAQAYAQWRETYESIRREKSNAARQQRVARELGVLLQKAQEGIREIAGDDVRGREAIGRLYAMYQRALRGEEI